MTAHYYTIGRELWREYDGEHVYIGSYASAEWATAAAAHLNKAEQP